MPFSSATVASRETLFSAWESSTDGLNAAQIQKRREHYGVNEISGKEVRGWEVWLRQFRSPLVTLLLIALVATFALGDRLTSGLILVFVLLNTTLAFSQEFHAERALQLLKHYVKTKAMVKRNGDVVSIGREEIVPGDLLILQAGDIIAADVRLVEVTDFAVDESILTGESGPVRKTNAPLKKAPKQISDADNIGFSGTAAISGKGVGLVIATGRDTEFGKIAKFTIQTRHMSSFEKNVSRMSNLLLRILLGGLAAVVLLHLLFSRGRYPVIELFLFAVALAITIVPEALPVITTISLARGALKLAKNKVVVKRLSAIEDLGSIDILCTDKTGTLTENVMTVEHVYARNQKGCLLYAGLTCCRSDGRNKTKNAFDTAIADFLSVAQKQQLKKYARRDGIPFDPIRRLDSTVAMVNGSEELIIRGAPEAVLDACEGTTHEAKNLMMQWLAHEGEQGHRVIAFAKKPIRTGQVIGSKDEQSGFSLLGMIAFLDPLKSTSKRAIEHANLLGIRVKILTGDRQEVAIAVAQQLNMIQSPKEAVTGEEFDRMDIEHQERALERCTVFARVSPEQKYRIIQGLQKKYAVGFLGEGINDAPALRLADVGLVVHEASDIARESADIILLNRSLDVIVSGIRGGRTVFENITKYIKFNLSSAFGNFLTLSIAPFFLGVLPLLPIQILLLDLLNDFPMIAVSTDRVDLATLKRPSAQKLRAIVSIAAVIGLVTTVFDFIFFGLFYRLPLPVLQTNWFIENILTSMALFFVIRSAKPILKARRASWWLISLAGATTIFAILFPFTGVGRRFFHFIPPTYTQFLLVAGITVTFFFAAEAAKLSYLRFSPFEKKKTPTRPATA